VKTSAAKSASSIRRSSILSRTGNEKQAFATRVRRARANRAWGEKGLACGLIANPALTSAGHRLGHRRLSALTVLHVTTSPHTHFSCLSKHYRGQANTIESLEPEHSRHLEPIKISDLKQARWIETHSSTRLSPQLRNSPPRDSVHYTTSLESSDPSPLIS
jgi:hypothetical protein